MAINGISSNLPSQYLKKTNITEQASVIYAKLNEDEQNFLDRDTIEKALHEISETRVQSNNSRFSLPNDDASESKEGQDAITSKQYELANELSVRMQALETVPIRQPQTFHLRVNELGVLVNDSDEIGGSQDVAVNRHVSLTV